MNLENLKEQLKAHGIKIGWTTKGLYKTLAESLPQDAAIAAAGEGFAGTNKAPVVVTEKHVVMASYPEAISLPSVHVISRDKVASASVEGGVLAKLVIDTQGQTFEVPGIQRPSAAKIASIIA